MTFLVLFSCKKIDHEWRLFADTQEVCFEGARGMCLCVYMCVCVSVSTC